jgi:hypothetical protein
MTRLSQFAFFGFCLHNFSTGATVIFTDSQKLKLVYPAGFPSHANDESERPLEKLLCENTFHQEEETIYRSLHARLDATSSREVCRSWSRAFGL